MIEAGKLIYISGTLHNIFNEEEQIKVDRIGPLVMWEKPQGWKSPLFVVSTQLENKIIQYSTHVDLFESEEGKICESSNV